MSQRLYKLIDIAVVRAGYPFRGQIQDTPSGTIRVVQMKHINEVSGISWQDLSKTNPGGRRNPDFLEKDDIIFAARGNNNFAVCLDEVPVKAVCSPHFYQIHIRDTSKVVPCYIAWLINQVPAQQYLMSSAEGTMIRSIRRGVLESLPLVIPDINKQKIIVELDARVKQENILLQKQMNNSRTMMNAIARDLMK